MHRYCTVYFMRCKHFFHLLMTFFIICYLHGSNAICFQCSDIIYVNSIFCCHLCGFHGILFSMFATHSGQCNPRFLSKASGLQTFCHLQKCICNDFFNLICHPAHPLFSHQGCCKFFHRLCDQSLYFFLRYTGSFFLCGCCIAMNDE